MNLPLFLLVAAGIVLTGMAAAEPQPVDSDWQRSDGASSEIETPTVAPHNDEPEPEPAKHIPLAAPQILAIIVVMLGGILALLFVIGKRRRAGR